MNIEKNRGFTLIELMVSIAIIGILAAIAIPTFFSYQEKAKLGGIVSDLKTFGVSFEAYNLANGCYPPDSHNDAPYNLKNGYGTENYLPIGAWTTPPAWGGFYNWEGPNSYPYAGISLFGTTASASTMSQLDRMMDDGVLTSGKFRQTANGRYTYIVNDDPDAACL